MKGWRAVRITKCHGRVADGVSRTRVTSTFLPTYFHIERERKLFEVGTARDAWQRSTGSDGRYSRSRAGRYFLFTFKILTRSDKIQTLVVIHRKIKLSSETCALKKMSNYIKIVLMYEETLIYCQNKPTRILIRENAVFPFRNNFWNELQLLIQRCFRVSWRTAVYDGMWVVPATMVHIVRSRTIWWEF